MMPAMRAIGILFFALAAGCAGVREATPGVTGQTGPLTVDPSLVRPNPAVVAQSPAADDAAQLKELTSVIMLLGMPCGQVVGARRQADNDHIASCKDGNRYRVFVNGEGRPAAQKQ